MKLFIFIVLFFTTLTSVYGQDYRSENLKIEDKKLLRFGYYIGINSVGAKMEYHHTATGQPFRIQIKQKPSFDVGLLADFRINEFLNIRFHPGVAFVERDILFPFSKTSFSKTLLERNLKSNYVRLPIGIKLNTRRIRNARPYIMGSLSYNMNITSEENNSEDNESGTFRMKSNIYAWEFAIGSDIYLGDFSTGIISYEFQNKTNYSQSHILKFTLNYSF